MSLAVDRILDDRLGRVSRHQRFNYVLVSLACHTVGSALVLLLPGFFHEQPEPLPVVEMMVIPPQALGSTDPTPPSPRVDEAPPPPAPPPPAPPVEEVPPPSDVPVLVEQTEAPEPEPEEPRRPDPPPPSAPPPPAPPPPAAERAAPPPPSASPLARRRGSPFGNPVGTSSSATLQGVEDPNFTYGYYLDRVLAVISQNWVRPVVGGVDDALLYFRIHDDGTVSQLRVKRSSGDESFDAAALRAVESSAPLPPLPKSYDKDSLGINLIVR
ncbi:MAG: energy transducer TonB [Acidobacteriota bacterium]